MASDDKIKVTVITPDVIVTQQRVMGQDRALVTPIDRFKASTFLDAILSGTDSYVSGQSLLTVAASNVVRIRPLNFHFQNRETTHMTVLFRDGTVTGGRVVGPFILNPLQDRTIPYDELEGRYFASGIYALVLSGVYSAGIQVNAGYVLDAQDYFE